MLILAFDTSSSRGCAGVFRDDQELASVQGEGRARHGDTLLPLVKRALTDAGVELGDVELLAVGIGPGSFTGLRVGVASAKGLALGLDCPLVGVPSPHALAAAAAPRGGLVATATRAYRGEVYAGLFRVDDPGVTAVLDLFAAQPAAAYERMLAGAAGEAFGCAGDGFAGDWLASYPDLVPADASLEHPQAALLAKLALGRFLRDGPDDAAALLPCYVRGADAELPKMKQVPRV